jgi:hypothetical protein
MIPTSEHPTLHQLRTQPFTKMGPILISCVTQGVHNILPQVTHGDNCVNRTARADAAGFKFRISIYLFATMSRRQLRATRNVTFTPLQAAFTLSFGASWRWMVWFTLRLLYLSGTCHHYSSNIKMSGPQSWYGCDGKETNFCNQQESSLGRPPYNQYDYWAAPGYNNNNNLYLCTWLINSSKDNYKVSTNKEWNT